MNTDDSSRAIAGGSRARDNRRSDYVPGVRATVEMIGIKWHAARHGDLRRRLRAAVERDGAASAADWLSDALLRRDAELSPASTPHPLAG